MMPQSSALRPVPRSAPREMPGEIGAPRRRRRFHLQPVLPLALMLLTGCSSEWIQARERAERANLTAPINPREEILAFMRTYLNDPTHVRDAYVSEPTLRDVAGVRRYSVCVRYNARKSSGQYAGSKDSLVLFRDGHLDRIVDSARELCKDAEYRPFPELQRLTR